MHVNQKVLSVNHDTNLRDGGLLLLEEGELFAQLLNKLLRCSQRRLSLRELITELVLALQELLPLVLVKADHGWCLRPTVEVRT